MGVRGRDDASVSGRADPAASSRRAAALTPAAVRGERSEDYRLSRRSQARPICIDPTLRPEFQALPLRASGAGPGARLEWRVDNTLSAR